MTFTMMIRSRPAAAEPVPDAHDRIMTNLRGLAPPPGLSMPTWPHL